MAPCTKHPKQEAASSCKICFEPYCSSCRFHRLFICDGCFFKILIMLLVAMIIVSFVAWFGIFG